MKKPITPRVHGLLDYGLLATNLVAPKLLGLPPRVRAVFAAFGLIQGGLNAVTAQPLAVKKVVPFATHGLIEKSSTPLYVVAPLVAGAARDPKSRAYWIAVGAALVAVYNLTDWKALPPRKR